ncbi:MAG TPA: DUF3786 domain-containing protein [Dehalococcoidales bacterium]
MVWQPPKDKTVYNLDVAYDIAKGKLAQANIKRQCERSGATLQRDGTITIPYLNQTYRLDITKADVSLVGSKKEVPIRDKILLIHYFVQSKGTPLSKNQITYRDLPGGLVYYPSFMKRTVDPLVDYFGSIPSMIVKAGEVLGASSAYMGDASLLINAFPHVPIYIIMWASDTELPPGGNILFDANIIDYLDSEDVTIVCETVTWRLINYANTL